MNTIIAFDNFLIYLRLHKGRSPKTLEQYAFHIWRLIRWLEPRGTKRLPEGLNHFFFLPKKSELSIDKRSIIRDLISIFPAVIESVKKEDIDAWRLELSDSGLSAKTVNAHIITIRSWLKYLKKEQIACLDPTTLDLMRVQDREVTFLTGDEIERYFTVIPRESIQGKRDYAISECIYSTGLRISELTALNRQDVNFDTLEFAVRGKGGKLRVVYLTEQASLAIQAYLEARSDHFDPLFIRHNYSESDINSSLLSDDSIRLSRFHITNMVKTYGLQASILKNMHAHTLRHSFATTLLTNGADIRIIQELLGHASITTTQVYTHVTNPKLKEAHQKYHK
ncbi:tyrosine-type recombinase/integrase [Candidatus Gracilibacteria bacterium]|nr:tyrosine-type recombinase/integrase [Candidatus Gracilibacteria bacterium]